MRRSRFQGSGEGSEDLHINLMPLIDVVFVVLIMFIVIAPMVELDRVELAYALKKEEGKTLPCQNTGPIAIYVKADNTIWIGKKAVTLKELESFLKKMRKEKPLEIPQVFQDRKSHFGTYQMVKNAVEESGFEQMDVILQPH